MVGRRYGGGWGWSKGWFGRVVNSEPPTPHYTLGAPLQKSVGPQHEGLGEFYEMKSYNWYFTSETVDGKPWELRIIKVAASKTSRTVCMMKVWRVL
jgi:hypothetical protein